MVNKKPVNAVLTAFLWFYEQKRDSGLRWVCEIVYFCVRRRIELVKCEILFFP